ncbi:MAG: TolB protein [Campylobacterota bacterium]|nr:TolB protein [Campylobacterota bacterium]
MLQAVLFSSDATIDVIKETKDSIKISVEGYSETDKNGEFLKKMKKMVIADLKVAGVFFVSDIEFPSSFEADIALLQYRENKIDYLLKFKTLKDNAKYSLMADLYDIKANKKVLTKKYSVSSEERYPFLSHKLIAQIAEMLNIEDLSWMEKFVIFAVNTSPKQSKIMIGDYSLTFTQSIINSGLNLFPKWRDSSQREFFYTNLNSTPVLYKADLYSGKKEKITQSDGMLVCSDVSEDGNRLLLTMAPEDQPDIYMYNLQTKAQNKITSEKSIDVNGNFLDDEESIVFVSDRLGKPNIFSKKLTGNSVEQMVYKGKNNNFCTSYKNYIAYVSRDTNSEFDDNAFNIYLISTKTDYIRQLTTTGKNLFPRFSPNGDTLLYIKNYKNESALGIIRLGYNKSFLFPLKTGKLQAVDW